MRLLMMPRTEHTVIVAFGSVQNFEDYLNAHTCWTFLQEPRRYLNGTWIRYRATIVLLCDRVKLVLSKPIIDGYNTYHYNVLTVLTPNRDDRNDALTGREALEEIQILNNQADTEQPEQKEQTQRQPPNIETVLALKRKKYRKLATHHKQAVNIAWDRLMKGRKVLKHVNSIGQSIFIITVTDKTEATIASEQHMNDQLEETGIGRITTDPYELKQARQVLDEHE